MNIVVGNINNKESELDKEFNKSSVAKYLLKTGMLKKVSYDDKRLVMCFTYKPVPITDIIDLDFVVQDIKEG